MPQMLMKLESPSDNFKSTKYSRNVPQVKNNVKMVLTGKPKRHFTKHKTRVVTEKRCLRIYFCLKPQFFFLAFVSSFFFLYVWFCFDCFSCLFYCHPHFLIINLVMQITICYTNNSKSKLVCQISKIKTLF